MTKDELQAIADKFDKGLRNTAVIPDRSGATLRQVGPQRFVFRVFRKDTDMYFANEIDLTDPVEAAEYAIQESVLMAIRSDTETD